MSSRLRFAHISDLHFSDGTIKWRSHKHSITHLQGTQRKFEVAGPFDHIIVSGDLTNSGDPESLARAYEWLFHETGIGGGERMGLKLPVESVGIVPGNHDAFNNSRQGGVHGFFQRSLNNFNRVFIHHPYDRAPRCKYIWLPCTDTGIFIAYVDSSYLGDPETEKLDPTSLNPISLPGRGKISIEQSERLLEWNDMGLNGHLPTEEDGDDMISANEFHRSLKILVMHHYLFEPPEYKTDAFLKVEHRKTVFRNVAMADFDVMLCGHKHVPCAVVQSYMDNFDRRARHRYLFNIHRRIFGIHMLPMQVSEPQGVPMGRRIWNWALVKLKEIRARGADVEALDEMEEICRILEEALEEPSELTRELLRCLARVDHLAGQEISRQEIRDLQVTLSSRFSRAQRRSLNNSAKVAYNYMKNLGSQSFLQVMAGSAAKTPGGSDLTRSVNVYEVERVSNGWRWTTERFDWDEADKAFAEAPHRTYHEFEDKRKPWERIKA